jgi:hypothetical protein
MKMFFHIAFSLSLIVMLVALLSIPQETRAQRFSHPNFGGAGQAGRPSAAPSQNFSRPAPAMNRPAAAPANNRPSQPVFNRQPQTQPQENRSTINGGSYNTGNHDYNQHDNNQNATIARPPVNAHNNIPNIPVQPHENVAVQRNFNAHENVNVYHNHYQPSHSYVYHPYHPYYWGHNWHPLGYIAASLATDAYLMSIANQQYYYDEGVYYQPTSGGYSVVPAPVGAIVSFLPPGYETTMVGNDYYYYYGGVFYIDTGNGYQVVPAPYGAVVTQIPDGAVEQDINGQTYLLYNNTYFQPVSQNGVDAYEVVQVN